MVPMWRVVYLNPSNLGGVPLSPGGRNELDEKLETLEAQKHRPGIPVTLFSIHDVFQKKTCTPSNTLQYYGGVFLSHQF